ncbi:hypothetical protein [Aquimarina sp. MMG016]|uniref:hypothetical protein n=1 Tax=Aquimarina sp. MMG016 TaxID=2822690 RepID=UPI001B39DE46|nr:hypothetical protein [Aquimarina sp. MMG016]MBQ4821802.1 hypothetical protein [Aquimarina sp. MMG016]
MKKLLLLLSIITFVGLSSCSKDEDVGISQEEKEFLVKKTLIELNKSVIKTGKFEQFQKSLLQKTATDNLNGSDIEALFLEFLGDQSQTFLDLYYQLEAMNMTGEEFTRIADQYEYLILGVGSNLQKRSSDCSISSLACSIWDWFRRAQEVANDEGVKQ